MNLSPNRILEITDNCPKSTDQFYCLIMLIDIGWMLNKLNTTNTIEPLSLQFDFAYWCLLWNDTWTSWHSIDCEWLKRVSDSLLMGREHKQLKIKLLYLICHGGDTQSRQIIEVTNGWLVRKFRNYFEIYCSPVW